MKNSMKSFAVLVLVAMATTLGAQSLTQPNLTPRPQEPTAPFPYRVEEVTFDNPVANITLAGTLTMPNEGAGFPAVVLITGSGAQNRDEEAFGHRPFLVLSDYLTRRGIAVLRYDDRGVGASGGTLTTDDTSADFATDVATALDYLATRPEIDHTRTGIAGHSEGGSIAFMVAAAHPAQVAFVVSMAGPGVNGYEISIMQAKDLTLVSGAGEAMADAAAEKQRADLAFLYSHTQEKVNAQFDQIVARTVPGFDALPEAMREMVRQQLRASNSTWARFFITHDPASDLADVKCPVLALNGTKDVQVRASVNLAAIEAGLAAGGNTAITVIEYPGLNHLFQTAVTGNTGEYSVIEETFSPRALEDIAAWILKTTE